MKKLLCIFSIFCLGVQAQAQVLDKKEVASASSRSSYYYGGDKNFDEFTYRFMQRNFTGETDIAGASFYPTDMNSQVHVLAYRYSLGDLGQIEIGANYQKTRVTMDIMGSELNSDIEGFGDTRIAFLHTASWSNNTFKMDLGMSVPTGSVNQKYEVMGRSDFISELGQTSSGTYDFNPVFTYKRFAGKVTVANKLYLRFRSGRNDRDYRLGNEIRNSAWVQYNLRSDLYAFARVNYRMYGDVVKDVVVAKSNGRSGGPRGVTNERPFAGPGNASSPVAIDATQGGSYVDMVLSAKYQIPTGGLGFLRPTIEAGAPVFTRSSNEEFRFAASSFISLALEAYF